jgi:flagellar hook-associated protein 2
MGTVGLSFGSPTSGAGFDVSATVAAIVGNLKNVETPWKTQLTALQAQDTAISSLGTLMSSLSNDLSQLTDFTGIMAQKTGSSSDNNVLQLTAASTSSVAGTHTVVVNNLAKTSSGYLTPITNASDTLAGSITLQVGGGTAKTINIGSSNNTLASLASAINSSGVGVTASVLTDSSGSRLSLVSGTSGGSGNLTITSSLTDASNSNASLGYTPSVTGADASLTVDGVGLTSASNTVTNLVPGLTFQLLSPSAKESDGSLEQVQIVIGNDNTAVESTVNQFVADYNSLIGAMNTQQGNDSSGNPEPLFGSPALTMLQQQLMTGLNTQNPNGYLDPVATNTDALLSGSITIQVGSGTAHTVTLDSSSNTLQGMANAINSANFGVTASVVTHGTESNLSLLSQTTGPNGALTVSSNILATSNTHLGFTGVMASDGYNASGALDPIASSSDLLAGSIAIQVGGGNTQTITLDSSNNTLQGLADAINGTAGIGVTATVSSDGTTLSLLSGTSGTGGNLTVTSNIVDTTTATTSTLNYTNSSDLSGLASLGISVSTKADGSLTFDASTLDSVLNSDFKGVLGFFQNANSWGQNFSTIMNNAGTSSSKGILSLAAKANSSNESTLNAYISREESLISIQQASLTAELNSANQIMQQLPTMLEGINQLYSAITGYNQNK